MNALTPMLAATVLAALIPTAIATPAQTGALAGPANRIAGLWSTQASVGPCNTAVQPSMVRNTLVFHAGGTVTEMARFPPAGVPNVYNVPGTNQRTMGLGKWTYDPVTGRHSMHLRFDWYVDGTFHGYQTVDREILLSNDSDQAAGPVRTLRYANDGSVVIELCGQAVSTRI